MHNTNTTTPKKGIVLMLPVLLTALLMAPTVMANDSEAKASMSVSDYVGYNKGFYVNDTTGNYSMKLTGRIQSRYEYKEVTGTDFNNSAFSIPAAYLKFSGNLVSRKIKYEMQLNFAKGDAVMTDAFADFAFVKNVFHLRVGQWNKPFARQRINSGAKLEFSNRSITDKALDGGRDIGFAFHNNYSKSPVFEWVAGLFNGTGEKTIYKGTAQEDGSVTVKPSNVPGTFHPLIIARVGLNLGGVQGYSEADLEGGAPGLSLGVAGIFDFDADDTNDGSIKGGFDYMFKAYGFSSTSGIYVSSIQDGGAISDQTWQQLAVHTQLGYVVKGKVQPLFRYAIVNPEGPENYKQEILGGLSIYFAKHNLKWQTEAGAEVLQASGESVYNTIIATQLQLAF